MKRKINLLLLIILLFGQSSLVEASTLQNKSGYSWYTFFYNTRETHQSSVNDTTTTNTASSHLYGLSNELTRFNLSSTYPGTTKKTLMGMRYSIKLYQLILFPLLPWLLQVIKFFLETLTIILEIVLLVN